MQDHFPSFANEAERLELANTDVVLCLIRRVSVNVSCIDGKNFYSLGWIAWGASECKSAIRKRRAK
jgi:hypothetical protein